MPVPPSIDQSPSPATTHLVGSSTDPSNSSSKTSISPASAAAESLALVSDVASQQPPPKSTPQHAASGPTTRQRPTRQRLPSSANPSENAVACAVPWRCVVGSPRGQPAAAQGPRPFHGAVHQPAGAPAAARALLACG